MSSQEDYLDKLIKEMSDDDDEVSTERGWGAQAPDLDALAEMSEEEIARRLSEGEAGTRVFDDGAFVEDVLDIPQENGGADLREIQDMLRKSDRNEAVDGGSGDLETPPERENPADKLLADIEKAGENESAEEVVSAGKEKALEKKRMKEEKKTAKAEAKTAKAEAKAAKAEAKAAAKAEKREKRRAKKGGASQAEDAQKGSEPQSITEYDMMQDKDLLDSIVSKAGNANQKEAQQGNAQQEGKSQADLKEPAATGEAERKTDAGQGAPFGDEETGAGEDGSEVMELDLDEIDDYIPDISKPSKEDGKEKKKGIVSKFVEFLMEEDEEPENENVQISDENQEIIRELDKEAAEKAKKKVQKKAKKKKAEKSKKEKKVKKPKKVKEPKPKKEKKPKEEEPYTGKKLSFKRVLPILLLGITVGAVTYIFVILSADYTNQQIAKNAFDAGDYQTCYTNLYGKKLNEAEEIMYGKSESILYIRMWYQEYLMNRESSGRAGALDSLIQTVDDYPALLEYAFLWGAETEVGEVYSDMLDILYTEYGITEAQAKEIAAIKSDIEYTRVVMAIADGKGYGGQNASQPASQESSEEENREQPDALPEEEELEEGGFVDNQ